MAAHCPSLVDTSSWVALRWERRGGYYRAHLEQDLWGHWIVTRVVGRRGAHRGRFMTTWVPSLEHGLMILGAIARRRPSGLEPMEASRIGFVRPSRRRTACPVQERTRRPPNPAPTPHACL